MQGQDDNWARFAVIEYDTNNRQFVFTARRWSNTASSYICQLQQGLFKLAYILTILTLLLGRIAATHELFNQFIRWRQCAPHLSPQPKWHLDNFSHFARLTILTDIQTADHTTRSVTIHRIYVVLWCIE